MVRSWSRGCLYGWVAARTPAERIRGCIPSVGITRFDTGVKSGRDWYKSSCGRFLLPGRRVPSSFSNVVSGARFPCKAVLQWYWQPVARDVMQLDPASVLFSFVAILGGFRNSFQVPCAKH
ncbi:unnamed protein product [Strongylus vulgaris]|uniref:Uncharacterized protein n=1 Tax=Strongylus vulgaris TaxID=40348 RepID=A0A3P7LC41_STRVU|nr:unnamed protein product [Strongylus vulgaris]